MAARASLWCHTGKAAGLLPLLLGTAGCFDVEKVDPEVDAVPLGPDDHGWIERNSIGVQGAWYTYGDQYGDVDQGGSKCNEVGKHPIETCSVIHDPDPLSASFPNTDDRMCTTGKVAVIPVCKTSVPNCNAGEYDYTNVWGAGIGLDLNTEQNQPGPKQPYNPELHGILGVSFEFESLYASDIRVEFPIVLPDESTTETHHDGSPYWGAIGPEPYPPSPVKSGYNHFYWEEVNAPVQDAYTFDRTKILAIQFHVPSVSKDNGTERRPFAFCISNLSFLRE